MVTSKWKALAAGMFLAAVTSPLFGQSAVNLSGTITDAAGAPVASAAIKLENSGLTATTGQDGKFTLTGSSSIRNPQSRMLNASIREGSLFLSLPEKAALTITVYGIEGKALSSIQRNMEAGSYAMPLPGIGSGIRFFKIRTGTEGNVVKALSIDGALRSAAFSPQDRFQPSPLAKEAPVAADFYDVLTATKTGFLKAYLSLSNPDSSTIKIKLLPENSPKFSFFVTGMKNLYAMSGNPTKGFGGDFRFGETGAGAGLKGADKICATIAEISMPGSSVKGWRAFLSVTADPFGKQGNAINRIGEGPWYDRTGRLLAPKKADLLNQRPMNGDPTIQSDLPNEYGIPNHRPDPTKPEEDNHHFLTGSTATGTLYGATATCKDWTTNATNAGRPRIGFSFPEGGRINWLSGQDEGGCGAGAVLIDLGGSDPSNPIVGSGGGYGGFYCFALNP